MPLGVFFFGLANVTIFGFKAVSIFKAGSDLTTTGWRAGLTVVCVGTGFYLAGTAVDHWAFFRDHDRAGVAAAELLGANDQRCDGMVLVRFVGDEAEYRCPKSISLGNMTSQPFVPWPEYIGGQSKELKAKIETMMSNAERATQPR